LARRFVYNAAFQTLEYHITHYDLEQGALEIQYIEEFFGEFPRKKTAAEIVRRLTGRAHLILLANAPLPDDPGSVVPVSFKVAHEITTSENEPKLKDLVGRLWDHVQFGGRRVLYTWIGGTRRDWRGQGHFRALTEQQELWAIEQGFDEIVVKTKNKFYGRQRRVQSVSEQEAPARHRPEAPQREDGRSDEPLARFPPRRPPTFFRPPSVQPFDTLCVAHIVWPHPYANPPR